MAKILAGCTYVLGINKHTVGDILVQEDAIGIETHVRFTANPTYN